jgi:hypothetical protein
MKYKNTYKIFFGVLLILLPWSISKAIYDTPYSAQEIVNESVGFYQTNTCRYSLGEIFQVNSFNSKIEILPDLSSKVECFGKINGVDKAGEKIKVYVGTNPNIDFLLQSIFWLLMLSFIPKSKNFTPRIPNTLAIFIMTCLLFLHLMSEDRFYLSYSDTFTAKLSYDNYLLLSLLVGVPIILNIFLDIIRTRFYNLVNFLPFVFLFSGTYNSLNLNFFLLTISFIGILSIQEGSYSKSFTFIYFIFSIIHVVNFKISNTYFDVDKLKGFINSSQNKLSLIFWTLIIYFFINGLFYIFKESTKFVDLQKLKLNFLISASLIVLIGIASSLYNYFNYLSYYYLGLNKLGIKSFNSIEGNTWRGISPSAEAAGEYFAIVLLFWLIVSRLQFIKIAKFEIVLIFITLYGLYRSNNFAATVGLILFTILLFLNSSNLNTKLKKSIYVVGLLSIVGILNYGNDYSYDFASKTLLHQGISASLVSESLPGNEYGLNAAESSNFGQILLLEENDIKLSSSLKYSLKEFTENGNIRFIPDKIATWSFISVPINRSEKWGIFLAKYNPTIVEALFGYGPQQLSDYYLGHPTKYNEGLVLPHSSLLDILIFYGFFGVMLLSLFIISKSIQYRKNTLFAYLCFFILINYIKSDSILYLSSFVLSIFIFNLYRYKLISSEMIEYE